MIKAGYVQIFMLETLEIERGFEETFANNYIFLVAILKW